jgi:hypothetical protein
VALIATGGCGEMNARWPGADATEADVVSWCGGWS